MERSRLGSGVPFLGSVSFVLAASLRGASFFGGVFPFSAALGSPERDMHYELCAVFSRLREIALCCSHL